MTPFKDLVVEIYHMFSSKFYLIRFYDVSNENKKLLCVKGRYEKDGYDYNTIKKEIREILFPEVYKKMELLKFISESERIKNEIEMCIYILNHKTTLKPFQPPKLIKNSLKREKSVVRSLTTKEAIIYSLPNAGFNTILAIMINFSFLFYINVMGQPPIIIGIILSLSLIIYAIMSTFWGSKVDRIGINKILLFGSIILTISSIFYWTPPKSPLEYGRMYLPLVLWFTFFSILFRIAGAAFQTSLYSLLPNLSENEQDRIKLSMVNMLMLTMGTIVGVMGPLIMMGQATKNLKRNSSSLYLSDSAVGEQIYMQIGLFSFLLCASFMCCLIFMLIKFKEQIKRNKKRPIQENKNLDSMAPFKDNNYRKWLITFILFWIPFIAFQFMVLNILMFMLQLRGLEFIFIGILALCTVIFSFLLWLNVSKRIGLRNTFIACLSCGGILFFLLLLLAFPMPHDLMLVFGFIIICLILCCLVGIMGLPLAIVSHFVDKANQASEASLTGAYTGIFIMFGSISAAISMLLVSFLLQLFGPENPFSYASIFLIGAGLVFIALMIFRKIEF